LLITKHMLFVGFSFMDDFHRIVHDVRIAITPDGHRDAATHEFGTALLIDEDDLRRRLFNRELEFATTADPAITESSLLPAARRAEIFLDCLLSRSTTNSPHLLDRTYDELLSEEERQLRERFQQFMVEAAPRGNQVPPAWREFEMLARRLGAHDLHTERG
jgi:hypothetical protein